MDTQPCCLGSDILAARCVCMYSADAGVFPAAPPIHLYAQRTPRGCLELDNYSGPGALLCPTLTGADYMRLDSYTLDACCGLGSDRSCQEVIYIYIYIYIYSETSLNRPTMGPTLSSPFREVVGLGS